MTKRAQKRTQGELLRELYHWSGDRNQAEFVKRFGLSRAWYNNAVKWDIIPEKEKAAICKAFHIPREYFEEKFDLPIRSVVEEPRESYANTIQLEQEINSLQRIIIEKDQDLLKAKDEIIRLMREIQEMRR